MAGLMDYLSNLKFEPDAKSMGLMNMAANMLQASNNSPTPVSFGNALGAGLNGFTGGYQVQKNLDDTAAAAEQKKLLDAATINRDNAMAGYYNTGGSGQNAVPTLHQSSSGWLQYNPITKKQELLTIDGNVMMPLGGDTNLYKTKKGMDPVQTVDANGNVDVVPTAELDHFYANNPQPQPFPAQQPSPQINQPIAPAQNQQQPVTPQPNGQAITEEQIITAYQNGDISKDTAVAALKTLAPPGLAPNELSLGVKQNPKPDLIQQASPMPNARQNPAQAQGAKTTAELNAKRDQELQIESQNLPTTMNDLSNERENIRQALKDLHVNGGRGEYLPGVNKWFDTNIHTNPQANRAGRIAGSSVLDTLKKMGGSDTDADRQFAGVISGLDPYSTDDATLEENYIKLLNGLDYKQQVIEGRLGKPLTQSYPNAPAIGTIVQGHMYVGGDPKDQNSWSD